MSIHTVIYDSLKNKTGCTPDIIHQILYQYLKPSYLEELKVLIEKKKLLALSYVKGDTIAYRVADRELLGFYIPIEILIIDSVTEHVAITPSAIIYKHNNLKDYYIMHTKVLQWITFPKRGYQDLIWYKNWDTFYFGKSKKEKEGMETRGNKRKILQQRIEKRGKINQMFRKRILL